MVCYFVLLRLIIRDRRDTYESSYNQIKNSKLFYIAKSYVKANGSTTSTIVRKLGTLDQLIVVEHGPTRDDVLAWAKNEVKLKTEKYKKEKEAKTVLIPFRADRQLDYEKQIFFRGGYLFYNPSIIRCIWIRSAAD